MHKKMFALMMGVGFIVTLESSANAQSTLDKIKRDGLIKVCTPQVVPDSTKIPRPVNGLA